MYLVQVLFIVFILLKIIHLLLVLMMVIYLFGRIIKININYVLKIIQNLDISRK